MKKTVILIDGTSFMGMNDAPEIIRITELEEIIITFFSINKKKILNKFFLYITICTEFSEEDNDLLYKKLMGKLLQKGINKLSYFKIKIKSCFMNQATCMENVFIDMIKDIQDSSRFVIDDYICIGDKKFKYEYIPENRIMEKTDFINYLVNLRDKGK